MTRPPVIKNSKSIDVVSKTTATFGLRINPAYENLLLRHGLDSLDALFAIPNDQTLGKPGLASWRERIRFTLDNSDKEIVVFLKRYNQPPRPVHPVRYGGTLWAKSHASIEWVWAQVFKEFGIACVEPIAFGEEFVGRKERRSAILLAQVPGRSLETWASQWTQARQHTNLGLLDDVASLVAQMHKAGLVHRDLYLSHIFFDPTRPGKQQLSIIDLQRVIRPSAFGLRWIVKDLAALHYSTPQSIVSRVGRFRWLQWYVERSGAKVCTKALAYRIIGKAKRMAAHDEHRQARLTWSPKR